MDAARLNALEEHATVLAYMKHDMAEGVAEIVFGDTEIFHHGFPDTVKNLSELFGTAGISVGNKRAPGGRSIGLCGGQRHHAFSFLPSG